MRISTAFESMSQQIDPTGPPAAISNKRKPDTPAMKNKGQNFRLESTSVDARKTFPSHSGETICGRDIVVPPSLATRKHRMKIKNATPSRFETRFGCHRRLRLCSTAHFVCQKSVDQYFLRKTTRFPRFSLPVLALTYKGRIWGDRRPVNNSKQCWKIQTLDAPKTSTSVHACDAVAATRR